MKDPSSNSVNPGALSASLTPSTIPAEIAAIGPPPQSLVEMDATASRVDPALRERIRALAKGANAALRRSPIRAAACWHEAGRLLSRRAGRYAEAWTCHSRALAIYPDYKPARDAMRRLARLSGDRDTLSMIIDSQIGRPSNPCETACLLSEQAALEIEAGRHAEAMDSLRDATAIYREALVPALLKLSVAVNQTDDVELAESLEVLIDKWVDPAGAVGLKLILALFEERLGRLDWAASRLNEEDTEALSLAGLWARARQRLRLDRGEEAVADLTALASRVDDPSMRTALLRWGRAIAVLSNSQTPDLPSHRAPGETAEFADLDLLDALRQKDPVARHAALQRLLPQTRTESLGAAIAIARSVADWAAGDPPEALPLDIGPPSPGAGGLAALIGAEFPWEPSATLLSAEVDPSSLLYASLSSRELGQAAGDLAELRERIADPQDRWALAVAEACVRLHSLEQPELALAALRGADMSPAREPFPSLLRLVDHSPIALAELVESQAELADSPQDKALLLAWAGRHREATDKERAREQYQRALVLDSTCLLALCGLERIGSGADELAKAWATAADSTSLETSTSYLVRASYWHRLGGAHARAAVFLLKAHKAAQPDSGLWEMAFKAAATHMRSALSSHVLQAPPGELAPYERACLGSLALEIAPEQAAAWFSSALEGADDAIFALGHSEALFESGQADQLVTSLSKALQGAQGEDAARIAARMALASKRQGMDNATLLRLLGEVAHRVPGHRPTGVKRAVTAALEHSASVLADALRSLATTSSDPTIASAVASAAWQVQPDDLPGLELASRLDEWNTLAHVELEAALAGHPEERAAALDRILAMMPGAASYWLRLAEIHRGAGEQKAAMRAYQQAAKAAPGDPLPLLRLATFDETETSQVSLDVLVQLARSCEAPTHQRELLRAAALAADEQPGERSLAGRLWAELLEASPENAEAFERALEIATELGEQELLCAVLKSRLRASLDPETERQLHIQLADPCLALHDRGAAKEHLSRASELMINDIEAHRRLAELHREDGEWHAAIERLMTAARLVRGPDNGIPVFFALGELYMDHSPRVDLAEKSFLRVLGWEREHTPSLERLAELYHRGSHFGRAVQALEHLVRLASTPEDRVEKSLALADVLENEFERVDDAERVLVQAWEGAPADLRPIEELAKLSERRFDNLSLVVFVDRAIAAHLADPAALCGDPAALGRVARLYELRCQPAMTAIAVGARNIALGSGGEAPEAEWHLGARIADPAYEELICPKALSASLRAVLRAVEEPVARALGVWVKQVDLGREVRLGRKDPLVVNVNYVSQLFQVDPPHVYTSLEPGLRLYPGSPAALVVPKALVTGSSSPALATFVAVSAAYSLSHGLSLATVVPASTLGAALSAVIQVIVPSATVPSEANAFSERIAEAMSGKVKAQIQPFAFDFQDDIGELDVPQLMREAADRAGLLGCGSLWNAVSALRLIYAMPDAPLGELPGYGALVAFCLSKAHLDLRESMGV